MSYDPTVRCFFLVFSFSLHVTQLHALLVFGSCCFLGLDSRVTFDLRVERRQKYFSTCCYFLDTAMKGSSSKPDISAYFPKSYFFVHSRESQSNWSFHKISQNILKIGMFFMFVCIQVALVYSLQK